MCRALSDGTGVVVSTVAICAVGALMHPVLGAGLFVAVLVAVVMLVTGRAESLAVRLLARARAPRKYELAALRPAVAVLEERDLAAPAVDLVVRQGQEPIRVSAAGRRTVVVSEGLIEAVAAGRVRPVEVAALMAHAIGRIRLGQTRYDVALEFWMMPWRALQTFGRGVGRGIGWFPLVALAWRLRFVTGAVALVQAIDEGRTVFGVLGAAAIGLSYVVPWAERQADLSAEDEADQFVMTVGLGDALSRFLERGRRTPRVLDRVHRLRPRPKATPTHPVAF
ncbi:hypothetical protein VV01_22040 [Luteipulveratus halotolerans]|uniref:Peptidase M48 domain-containing protein n=2 Tax=Luteipulveratus halotolerans TaxID=1631356 RepID=A0A0L6CDF2_9MICO|nr:hypothetical protein VV01_21365 [Luteipulveratus halotolerans]KNX35937.1 hypothetical protein VV01_22040 [Luteipulveratus halotolerans]